MSKEKTVVLNTEKKKNKILTKCLITRKVVYQNKILTSNLIFFLNPLTLLYRRDTAWFFRSQRVVRDVLCSSSNMASMLVWLGNQSVFRIPGIYNFVGNLGLPKGRVCNSI